MNPTQTKNYSRRRYSHLIDLIRSYADQVHPWIMVLVVWLSAHTGLAQLNTHDNYTGDWADAGSWETAQPVPLTLDVTDEILVYGKITVSGNLQLANSGTAVTVKDTLIVDGDLTFNTPFAQFFIDPGAVLIVLGNFNTMGSFVSIEAGGVMVVSGDLTLDGSSLFNGDPGNTNLYVDGTSTETSQTFTQLESDYPGLYTEFFATLPITLSSFQGTVHDAYVQLTWVTQTEENFDHFLVERSGQAEKFQKIGVIDGHGTSYTQKYYKFIDANPEYGISYYRLTAFDLNGTFEIFPAIRMKYTAGHNHITMYPNPTNTGQVNIRLNSGDPLEALNLSLYDPTGRLVQFEKMNQRSQTIHLNPLLTSGHYQIRIEHNHQIINKTLIIR